MKKIALALLLLISTKGKTQVDSTYYHNSRIILSKQPKSKISAEHLFDAAQFIYNEYNILVPYKLAISQAIIESSLGTKGVGRDRNNPFSLNSKKGYIRYDNIADGVMAYYIYITKNYLQYKSVDKLMKNFVNNKNKRYASDKTYESKLRRIYQKLE